MIVNKTNLSAYLKLFASIKLTSGHSQSLLIDFDRNKMRTIPNDLYNFIARCKLKPLNQVLKKYTLDDQVVINKYLGFLAKHEYVIFTNNPNHFPEIDLTWKSPNYISNAVIDVANQSNHDYPYLIKLLDDLGCLALNIRVFKSIKSKNINKLLAATEDCRLKSLRIYLPYSMATPIIDLAKYPRLDMLVYHGAPKNKCNQNNAGQIQLFITNQIDSPQCCGHVSEQLMIGNLELFSEAQCYNTCLNKKLCIDDNGLVKNCNAMKKSFGHYKQVNIKKLIQENKNYTRLWQINKDKIHICKDCEFRYVCVDCRALIANENNLLSKPSRCNYNPYTATWQT